LTRLNVSAERIATLRPPYDTAHFPIVLDPAPETQLPADSEAEAEVTEEPIVSWWEQWKQRQQSAEQPARKPQSAGEWADRK
jgi:hypothetical protein